VTFSPCIYTNARGALATALAICLALLLISAPASADRATRVRGASVKTGVLRPMAAKHTARRPAPRVERPAQRKMPDRSGRVRVIGSPKDDAAARLHLIDGAKKSLQMNTYVLANDRVGWMMAAKLIQAAKRGVDVKFVADATGAHGATPVLDAMAKGGVKVAVYNRLSWKTPLRATRRMHDKLLIADGERMIVGARNMASAYYHLRSGYRSSSNTDTYVEGSSAQGAARYFDKLFSGKLVERLRTKGSMSTDQAKRLAHADRLWARISPRLTRHFETLPEHSAEKVRFVHDSPETFSKTSGTRTSFYAFLRAAKKRVTIHTPYVVPTAKFLAEVERAVKRGVKVKIVTNSWKTTDTKVAQIGYESMLHRLAKTGAEIWEYSGKHSLHSKTIVADGELASPYPSLALAFGGGVHVAGTDATLNVTG